MLLPLLDSGTDVLLLLHSYGGLPAAAAATGQKEGKKEGILGLVFIAAFVAREGGSLDQMVGGTLANWIGINV